MVTFKTLDSSIISFIVLFIIFIHSYSRRERLFAQYKLFNTLVILTMALIVIDILGWAFNGLPGSLNYFLNVAFNLILYITGPMVPCVWLLYTHYVVINEEIRIKNIKIGLLVALAVNACIASLSLFTGWYFYVDSSNIYHRGPWFLAYMAFCEFLLLYSLIFVIRKRNQFQKRQFYSVMLFFVAPLIGSIIQALNYGVSYVSTGIMLSLLIIYFNLQSRNLNTDYLTGVNNRLRFQIYIKEKIRNSSEKRPFGAILMDIDNFKNINDTFGHGTGDAALRDAVQILKNSLRRDDFIARFGGDEFLVVLDIPTLKTLEETVARIRKGVETFNAQGERPYRLDFSLGYDIYRVPSKMSSDEYIDHLDRLMYEDKRKKLEAVTPYQQMEKKERASSESVPYSAKSLC